jgi:hypothetical protein
VLVKELNFLSSRKRRLRCLPVSMSLLLRLRMHFTGAMARSKVYYHVWFAVVRAELRLSFDRGTLAKGFMEDEQYRLVLYGHSLGPDKISGSKAFLYKATLQRLRDLEERLALVKVRGA